MYVEAIGRLGEAAVAYLSTVCQSATPAARLVSSEFYVPSVTPHVVLQVMRGSLWIHRGATYF